MYLSVYLLSFFLSFYFSTKNITARQNQITEPPPPFHRESAIEETTLPLPKHFKTFQRPLRSRTPVVVLVAAAVAFTLR